MGPPDDNPPERLLRSLRHDPRHLAELVLLRVGPQLAPNAARWLAADRRRRPGLTDEARMRRLLRRATGHARRDGAITGSSFYVGMLPAMGSLYCRQVMLVLQVAALHGLDPTDPGLLADFLVLRGRHPDRAAAADALTHAGRPEPRAEEGKTGLLGSAWQAVQDVPAMVGVKVNAFRTGGVVNGVLAVAKLACYVVPFISIPTWAIDNARTTRKLGRDASTLFSGRGAVAAGGDSLALPPLPSVRRRRVRLAAALVLGAALALAVPFTPLAHHLLAVKWVGIVAAEAFLAATLGRTLWVLRA